MISVVIINKDEPLRVTLHGVCAQADAHPETTEVVVVDASRPPDASLRADFSEVRWIDFTPPPGVGVSIPHQRNAGVRAARGAIIVFIDARCAPGEGWLDRLVAPILAGAEQVVAGGVGATDGDSPWDTAGHSEYLSECPTINLAFTRSAVDAVGAFDESFAYGSDVDFSWRLNDAGFRILRRGEARIRHEWGSTGRRLRRSFDYGVARGRLYRKHARRIPSALRSDPVPFTYPVFLLGLPLARRFPLYPALLLIPAWRNRRIGPVRAVIDHLIYGAGTIVGALRR